jgi:hypothetical protein
MNNKFLKITALVFATLAIIIAFPWLKEMVNSKKVNPMENASVKLSQFTQETVTKISIKKGGDEKILSFSDNKWLISNDEADADKVKQLFQSLADLKTKEMVSENQDNWQKFEATSDAGFRLAITQNDKDNVFFVGKSGASANDFYMRRDGIKNVYLVNGELRNMLGWTVEQWKKSAENK